MRIGNSFVRLIMTHGYMLSGTGSNVYVQNLCRALSREGHDVHLLCQEREALSYGFVAEHYVVDGEHIERRGVRETPYPGRCAVYNPEIGDLLPVYVYDEYPGWRVKTFLDLTDEELESYLARNVEAVRAVIEASSAEAVVTNHSVPGAPDLPPRPRRLRCPLREHRPRQLSPLRLPQEREVHAPYPRGAGGGERILALSSHSAGTIAEDFPDLEDRTTALPGGVDTKLFRPDALNPDYLRELSGTLGRGPEQEEALVEALESSENAGKLVGPLREISASYDARSPDRDFGERVGASLAVNGGSPSYSTSASSSTPRASTASSRSSSGQDGRPMLASLVIGFGTFREGLQALTPLYERGRQEASREHRGDGQAPRGRSGGAARALRALRGAATRRGGDGRRRRVRRAARPRPTRAAPAGGRRGRCPLHLPRDLRARGGRVRGERRRPVRCRPLGPRGRRVRSSAVACPLRCASAWTASRENLARTLIEYLELPDEERRRYEEVVQRNCIEHLGWGTLAQRIVELVSDREIRPWK